MLGGTSMKPSPDPTSSTPSTESEDKTSKELSAPTPDPPLQPSNLPTPVIRSGLDDSPLKTYYDPTHIAEILGSDPVGLNDHLEVLRTAMLLPDRDPKTMLVKMKAEDQLWKRKRELLRLAGLIVDTKQQRTITANGSKITQTISGPRLVSDLAPSAAEEAARLMRAQYKPPETTPDAP